MEASSAAVSFPSTGGTGVSTYTLGRLLLRHWGPFCDLDANDQPKIAKCTPLTLAKKPTPRREGHGYTRRP